ncbi:TetR family transcriptional regulator [Nonomuraea sp. ATR24]|uniref:TetR family transcriptional regulator n=1 Tax=Nonomuraea TaxID=83681 RepID=UPI001C603918|nr:TetR family transcriptional regulator [Nonomuraea ceibae]
MDSTLGLRERKKAETRQAVHEAALRLTIEHGFDAVTVEAIADAANISRRTFSNYFAGKEDAILYGDERRIRALVERVRAEPADRPAWLALRGAVQRLYEEIGVPEREQAVRTRLAMKHPSLLARQLANHAAFDRELAQALALRRGGGVSPRVMAAAFLAALRLATHTWIEEEQARPLHEVIDETLEQMARPFT